MWAMAPARQFFLEHQRHGLTGPQAAPQRGAGQRPSPHVEAEADQRIPLLRAQGDASEQLIHGGGCLGNVLQEPGVGLLLADALSRPHVGAVVAVADAPAGAARRIGVGLEAAALQAFEQLQAGGGERHRGGAGAP